VAHLEVQEIQEVLAQLVPPVKTETLAALHLSTISQQLQAATPEEADYYLMKLVATKLHLRLYILMTKI
jgi:hypothetical protein